MLRRLVQLSAGVAGARTPAHAAGAGRDAGRVRPARPPAAGRAPRCRPPSWRRAAASPRHPPGLVRAGERPPRAEPAAQPPLPEAAPAIAGARVEPIGGIAPERALGPLAARRWRWRCWRSTCCSRCGCAACCGAARPRPRCAVPGRAAPLPGPARRPRARRWPRASPMWSDRRRRRSTASRAPGSPGLSDYVNRRTAASLAEPAAVTPGTDDLSFYPLLYWPIAADAAPPRARPIAALNGFMAHGGIILIDTRDGGSGERLRARRRRARCEQVGQRPRDAAAGPADHGACAGARLLPAAGLPGPLRRRHGLGAARPGPQQRQRQPGHHRRP